MKYVGESVLKEDAWDKVAGKAQYVEDIKIEGMLWGIAVRSPYAHAIIKNIKTEELELIPGVHAVITAKDIPGENRVGPSAWKDQPVIAEDKVRFFGEAVALIAAESKEMVKESASKVIVEYEEIKVISELQDALKKDCPVVHTDGNVFLERKIAKGNFRNAKKNADLVVENIYQTKSVDHAYMEPDSCLAVPQKDGGVLVYTSTKSVHHDKEEISRVLGLEPSKVRVKAATIGGSFGGKSDIPLICMTSLLAVKTQKPVKMVYSREEVFHITSKRHSYIMKYTHVVRKDGKILGVKVDVLIDAGAYKGYTPSVLGRALIHAVGPYNVDNVSVCCRAVYTNKTSSGAMRGYGVPQLCFAYEAQMDEIAQKLKINPLQLRLINAFKPGDRTITGQRIKSDIRFKETIKKVGKIRENSENTNIQPSTEKSWIKRGWGMACCMYGNGRTGQPNPGIAKVQIEDDCSIMIYVGSPDIGQGSNTIFRQIAAEILQINIDKVNIISADTEFTEDSGTTSGTRLTFIVGNAVKIAAEDLYKKLSLFLNEYGLDLPLDNCLIDLVRKAKEKGTKLFGRGFFDPPTSPLDSKTGQGVPYGTYTFGTQYVEIEVNILTGKIKLEKFIACYDNGRVINPTLYKGQVIGGIVMGIGYAFLEDLNICKGKITNDNFDSYILPTSLDVPDIDVNVVISSDELGPFGAKGIGEPAIIPTAAAIANAVSRALKVRARCLPLNLEKVIEMTQRRDIL